MSEPAVSLEQVLQFFDEELPFCAAMNISCDHIARGVGVARFTFDERFTRPGEIVNGGTLMTLADVAVYIAVFSRIGIVPLAVTSELKMNFLRPAIGHDVLARATILKQGRRVAYASVDLNEPHDPQRLVAHATASYVLPD